MSTKYKVLCGVPEIHCTGGTLITDQRLDTTKAHGSHPEAYRCMRHYLLKVKGYTQDGSMVRGRDFRPPDGGPVLILTKQSRFGSRMRAGKGENRYMPDGRYVGIRGVIMS